MWRHGERARTGFVAGPRGSRRRRLRFTPARADDAIDRVARAGRLGCSRPGCLVERTGRHGRCRTDVLARLARAGLTLHGRRTTDTMRRVRRWESLRRHGPASFGCDLARLSFARHRILNLTPLSAAATDVARRGGAYSCPRISIAHRPQFRRPSDGSSRWPGRSRQRSRPCSCRSRCVFHSSP